MSRPTEQEFYDWFYSRISGNGSVRFDSDALLDEEPWVRYFARSAVRMLENQQMELEEKIMLLSDEADEKHGHGDTRPDWMWVANTLRKLVEDAETF